jgi:hypothetical protein
MRMDKRQLVRLLRDERFKFRALFRLTDAVQGLNLCGCDQCEADRLMIAVLGELQASGVTVPVDHWRDSTRHWFSLPGGVA